MAKLTDTQMIVLSKASAREDGIAIIPAKMNKAGAAKVAASLVARKLMREVRSKPGMPVWREDADNRSISLMITRAGRGAIGVDDEVIEQPAPAAKKASEAKASASAAAPANASTPRAGSKQALVIGMLQAKSGATLDALVEATGWLPHTTRAALTGLRKRGYAIELSRNEGKPSIYRIVAAPMAAAA